MVVLADMPSIEQHRVNVRRRLRAASISLPGPDSVSWSINREVVVLAGWGRAMLLQFAHPLVAAGVGDHSRFRGSLTAGLRRLRSTMGAMLALTFGNEDEVVAAAARINAIHDRVSGRLDADTGPCRAGDAYSAHDPELLRWVHATLLDSILLTHQLLVGPLTPDECDRYCAEAAVMEPLLGIPVHLLPRNRDDLDRYMTGMLASGSIAVSDRSRALARAVLFPPRWWLLWFAFRPVHLITVGLLPASVRQAYGFEWTERQSRALARWANALRRLRRLAPVSIRQWRPLDAAGAASTRATPIGDRRFQVDEAARQQEPEREG